MVLLKEFNATLPNPVFWVAAGALATALFSIDLILPLGASSGILYIALVLVGGLSRRARSTFVMAGLASVLMSAAFLIKVDAVAPIWVVATNRMISCAICWALAGYMVLMRNDGPTAGRIVGPSRTSSYALLALAAGFLIVLVASLTGARLSFVHDERAGSVEQAFQTQRTLTEFLRVVRDAESGQRGYLLTGNEEYLGPFLQADRRFPDEVSRVRRITVAEPEQSPRIGEAIDLAEQKMNELRQTVSLAQSGQRDEAVAIIDSNLGARVMTRFREAVSAAIDAEEVALAARLNEQRTSRNVLLAVQVGGTVLLFLVASTAMFVAWRDNRAVALARDQLAASNVSLEARVIERTAELARATEDLASQSAQTRLALESGDVGTWAYEFTGRSIFCDGKCRDVYGFDAEDIVRLRDMAGRVHIEDRGALRGQIRAALAGDGSLAAEHRVIRLDGSASWVIVRGQIYFDEATGRPLRISGTIVDITDRKAAEESQSLLLRELAHRVKNILAVVQSLAALSARAHPEAETFIEAFKGRLAALSLAHTLLIGSERQAAKLSALAEDALRPFADREAGRITVEVSEATLRAAEAQTLALLLHELATNSSKYGALSVATGAVAVTSQIERDSNDDGRRIAVLVLEWREEGGPPVTPPTRRGFGMTLLERAVRLQHGGSTDLDWRREGLIAVVRLPLTSSQRLNRIRRLGRTGRRRTKIAAE